jgi:hypothetical protein
VTFLHSGTGTHFVTSDQPIVNLRVQPDGSSREVELYYPLSPDLAMLLSLDAQRPTVAERQLSAAETIQCNARLGAERETQIYALDVADLDFGT